MSSIKVFGKENGVAILLPPNNYIYGDPDGDFVAENGSNSDTISVKRSVNDLYVINNLLHTEIVDKDGNAIAATRDAVVTALNNDYFNRGSSLFEIGDVDDPGSANLSKTVPNRKLALKVKADGSGFEMVDKAINMTNLTAVATSHGGDQGIMKVSLTKALETPSSDEETSSVVRFAVRPGTNVSGAVTNTTLSGQDYVLQTLNFDEITAAVTLSDNGRLVSSGRNLTLTPAATYDIHLNGDVKISGDIVSDDDEDLTIDLGGTGRVRLKSEIMPHADEDLVIHSDGTGNVIVKPDLQIDGEIVTGSNDDLVLNPGGTGAIVLQANDIRFEQTTSLTGGEIRLNEYNGLGSNYVALRAPLSLNSDLTFTLPFADGTSGQVLQTNGAGTLSFKDVANGTSANLKGVTSLKAIGGIDAQLAIYDDDGSHAIVLRAPDSLSANTTFRLPASDGTDGQVIKTNGSGQLSFVDADSGPVGATGLTGSTGLSGATGLTGSTGLAGSNGSDGSDGNQGATGFTGATGLAGSNGSDGNQGATGFAGATGLAGSNGSNGSDGNQGATGFTGATGAAGAAGSDGSNGSDGNQGATGFTGATGPAGSNGADGADGSDALALAGNDQTLTGNRVINTNGNNFEIKDGAVSLFTYTDATSQLMLGDITNVQKKTGPGELRFKETPTNGTNHIAFQAPASLSSDTTFVLPSADGTDGQYLKTDGSGTLSFDNPNTKFTQVYLQNFFDDIGTTIHYLPFKDINEQTTVYQEEAAMLMPFDGRIKSMSLRVSALTGSGNFTASVRTLPSGTNQFSGQSWTIEENEVMAFTGTDDYHTFHFVFDNDQHFEAGDLCTMSLIASADPGGYGYWYVSTIVEFDTSTDLGSSSTEHGSNP